MTPYNKIVKVIKNTQYEDIRFERQDGTRRTYQVRLHNGTSRSASRDRLEDVVSKVGVWEREGNYFNAGFILIMHGSNIKGKLSDAQRRCLLGLAIGDFVEPTAGYPRPFSVSTVRSLYRLGYIQMTTRKEWNPWNTSYHLTDTGKAIIADKLAEKNLDRTEAEQATEARELEATLMRAQANEQYRKQSFSPVGVRFAVSNQHNRYIEARIGEYAIVRQTRDGISLLVSEKSRFGSTQSVQVSDDDLHKFFEAMHVAKQLVAIMDTPLDFA